MTTSIPDNQNNLFTARVINIANKLQLENMNMKRQREKGQNLTGVDTVGNRIDSFSNVLNSDAFLPDNQEGTYTDSYDEDVVGHKKCSPSAVTVLLNEVTRTNSGELHQKEKKNSFHYDKNGIVRTCDTDPGSASPSSSPCRYWVPLGNPPGVVLELWKVRSEVLSDSEENSFQTLDLSLKNEERLFRIWPWGKKRPVEGSVRTESRTVHLENAAIRAMSLWGRILSNAVNSFGLHVDHCNDKMHLEQERERLNHQRDVLVRCHAVLCVESVPLDWVRNGVKENIDTIKMRQELSKSKNSELNYDSNTDDGGRGIVSEDKEGKTLIIDSGKDEVKELLRGSSNSKAKVKVEERSREMERDVRRCITWQCSEIQSVLDSLGLTVCKVRITITD